MSPETIMRDRQPSRDGGGEAVWSTRELRRFLGTFALASVVLLAPWPRLGRVFSAAFVGFANVTVDALVVGEGTSARFSMPAPAERRRPDVGEWSVLLSSNAGDGAREMVLDTRILGYTPLAVFVALVVATPVPRRRKLKILGGGGAIVLGRLACAIALPVGRALGARGPSWAFGSVAEVIWWAFINPPAMSYVTAAFGWWIALALTTWKVRASDVRTGGGRRGSARTRASRRDRGKTSKEARA